MRYRIKRIGKRYHAQIFVRGLFWGSWCDINTNGQCSLVLGQLSWYEDSKAAAQENIGKHKIIEAENNDIEIIEVKD